jgi:molecular chaperone GrpE (heat shock protein)
MDALDKVLAKHSVERAIPEGHRFPPCAHCHQAVTWVIVRVTHTK